MISMIAALDENNVIGRSSGGIPWEGKMPADVAYFRKKTVGHTVVMGFRMYLELDKPLPHRRNIVISARGESVRSGFELFESLEAVLELDNADSELFIVGGGGTYASFMPYVSRLYVTRLHTTSTGDVYFPVIGEQWRVMSKESHSSDENNAFDYDFIVFERH